MGFLKNMRIAAKTFSGFGIVLALLVILSGFAILRLNGANSHFSEYRSLARQANEIGLVQANMLTARIAVKDFILSGDPHDLEVVN